MVSIVECLEGDNTQWIIIVYIIEAGVCFGDALPMSDVTCVCIRCISWDSFSFNIVVTEKSDRCLTNFNEKWHLSVEKVEWIKCRNINNNKLIFPRHDKNAARNIAPGKNTDKTPTKQWTITSLIVDEAKMFVRALHLNNLFRVLHVTFLQHYNWHHR